MKELAMSTLRPAAEDAIPTGTGVAAWLVAAAVAAGAGTAAAMPPPQSPQAPPADTLADVRTEAIEAYVVRRGLRTRTEAAQSARRRIESLPPGLRAVAPIVGTAVAGAVEVPIAMVRFSNTLSPPYPVADLQQALFDGPSPTGTMSEHYREMSGDRFDVTGEVFDWVELPQNDLFYSGPAGCNGICGSARLGDMLTAALTAIDQTVDFRRFDNNGPDNVPNSADDDGFVDFVAFVHPESGGECDNGANGNIWSHRFSVQSLIGSNFQTNDIGQQGFNVLIDDYVIMPAFACDGRTMIQIGVFSHEFGHAFGLPDLYDSEDPPESAGIGGWGLMASGSWGGDGLSNPASPSHMTAWSKEFLGWVSPRVIEADESGVRIEPVIGSGDVVRVDYSDEADPSDTRYLLLEYRTRDGFDRSLTSDGLLVTEINNTRVQGGLQNNAVNGSPLDMGVNVIEADGDRDLDDDRNRADAGDVFPGSDDVTSADVSHAEGIRAALCNIVQTPEHVTLDVFTSRTTCPGALAAAAVPPSEVAGGAVMRGEEVVVEGVLTNEGTNYFADRRLVVTGEGTAGGKVVVTSPVPLETIAPPSTAAAGAQDLSDILGKKVLIRGRLQKEMQKGTGLTDVLVVEEFEVVE
jgi:M6 family metalloprotease-like protein